MLRLLALALSLLFFWAGWFEASVDLVGLAAGGLFMILFLGTFLSPAHAAVALGGALCAMALTWLAMGRISLSRSAGPADIETEPLTFWIRFAVLFGCGVALFVGGMVSSWVRRDRLRNGEDMS